LSNSVSKSGGIFTPTRIALWWIFGRPARCRFGFGVETVVPNVLIVSLSFSMIPNFPSPLHSRQTPAGKSYAVPDQHPADC
jgi:hypothetical protein